MNIIIPATGIGKRFKEAGYKDLKPFIPVNEKKIILDYVIECFDVKNDKFYFIVQEQEQDKFKQFVKSRNINAKIIIYYGEKLGPSGSLYGVKEEFEDILDEEVIVSYCDFGQEWDYDDFLNFTKKYNDTQCIIPCYTGYHPHLIPLENLYAACKTYDNSYKVYKVLEKYNSKDKFNEYYSSGIYYFRSLKLAFEAIKKQIDNKDILNGEYYISIACNYLNNILCYPFVEKFYQFGTPGDFEYAKNRLNSNGVINDDVNINNVIVLSAGRGERFLKLNFNQPKPFLPLGDSFLVKEIIKTLKNIKGKIICVGAKDHEKYWDNINEEVRYVKPNKIGAAYSYKESCSDLIGDVLILPCDLIAKHINDQFKKVYLNSDIIIFVTKASKYNYDNPDYFTWINGNNGIAEKISVKHRLDNSDLIMVGSFYFKQNSILIKAINDIFENNIQTNGEFFIDNVFELLIKDHKISYVEVGEYFSFGTPEEYKESRYWFENNNKEILL
ncbi:glycosyl transferase family 2 [Campylobacter lari]|nr:glycosyl transferase family 2 [Campylobacter lari]EAH8420846.1 glycosyl transferase family 2 [Campylobacter lari]EAK5790432.1 glycosyl transferase family 2 [Campylobacter lari]EAK5966730.1 glycosyl transferase family 2 [Campylobacter lari]EAL2231631.1 glycosyl transferase family 2 [Campylobacter lari]